MAPITTPPEFSSRPKAAMSVAAAFIAR